MFEYIEPKEHCLYKDRIIPFLEELADNPRLYEAFEDWDQATFLLAGDKNHCIQGGALLLKQDIEMLHPRIQEHIRSFYPRLREVWTGMISLQVKEELSGRAFEKHCKFFYCALMAELIAFGIKETTPFLCLTMTPLEYHSSEMLGRDLQSIWPYAIEVKPESSRDGLFHGVLTLIDMNLNFAFHNPVRQRMTVH